MSLAEQVTPHLPTAAVVVVLDRDGGVTSWVAEGLDPAVVPALLEALAASAAAE